MPRRLRARKKKQVLKGQITEERFSIAGAINLATGEWDRYVTKFAPEAMPAEWTKLYDKHYVNMIKRIIDRVPGMEDPREIERFCVSVAKDSASAFKKEWERLVLE